MGLRNKKHLAYGALRGTSYGFIGALAGAYATQDDTLILSEAHRETLKKYGQQEGLFQNLDPRDKKLFNAALAAGFKATMQEQGE